MASSTRTRKSKNWRVLDHTADLRIEVRGISVEELFLNAAQALAAVLTEDAPRAADESLILVLEAETLEELLVEWLRELLFQHQVHGNVFVGAVMMQFSDTGLKANVSFSHTPRQNAPDFEIKGVTYHGLNIVDRGGIYAVQIIFDI